jgi:hypothetical protein
MRATRLVLVVVLCAALGVVARIAHSDVQIPAQKIGVHLADHSWAHVNPMSRSEHVRLLRQIVKHDVWVVGHARSYHFLPTTVAYHRRELRHARAKLRSLGPVLHWQLVGATGFGGPSDCSSTGTCGDSGSCNTLSKYSFAELAAPGYAPNDSHGYGTALGRLPCYTRYVVRNPITGATAVFAKRDVGYGQGSRLSPGGHHFAIDIWYQGLDAVDCPSGWCDLLIAPAPAGWREGPR